MEIELRAKLDDKEKTLEELKKIKATLLTTKDETDYYYKQKNVEKREFIIRIRVDNNKKKLTYKSGKEGAWTEKEVIISNENEMDYILTNTCFEKFLTIKKLRTNFKLDNININIDQIQGFGDFIEAEIISEDVKKAKSTIESLFEKLKIKKELITNYGYVKLLLNEL